MGQHLARLLYASALSGCSLIYNPSNLPDKGSEPPDAPIADANPALLHLDEVKTPFFFEGAGQDGSAPQLLVVYGGHITGTATVTLTPKTPNPDVTVELSNVRVAKDGNSLAGTVKVGYMDNLDESGPNAVDKIPLVVTVTQDGAPAPVSFESDDLYVKPLDELAAIADFTSGKLYSRIEVTGDITFPAGGARPSFKAVGSIKLPGTLRLNAAGQTAGAGGCMGGTAGSTGGCFGGGGVSGGGGGFANRGSDGDGGTGGPISGDPLQRSFDGAGSEVNRGGGGGGGGAGSGAMGGGSGGSLEVVGGGTVEVGSIEANGAAGDGVAVLARAAGGGAGGAVVLRSGATLTFPPSVTLAPGGGGSGGLLGTPGGEGSIGRYRFDAITTMGSASANPSPKRGPVFMPLANPILDDRDPQLTVIGDPVGSGASVSIVVQYPDGTTETKSTTLTGTTSTVEPPMLAIGYNVVCVLIAGGNFASPEAKNCIDVAFLP